MTGQPYSEVKEEFLCDMLTLNKGDTVRTGRLSWSDYIFVHFYVILCYNLAEICWNQSISIRATLWKVTKRPSKEIDHWAPLTLLRREHIGLTHKAILQCTYPRSEESHSAKKKQKKKHALHRKRHPQHLRKKMYNLWNIVTIINSIIELLLYTKSHFLNFTLIKICFSATVRNSNIRNFTSLV